MHIPQGMLNGPICPVTAVIAAAGVAGAAAVAMKSEQKPGAARFAAITAFIFAAQMMNFPVQSGTSGHLLGGVLAAALMGTPFGILSMAIVLAVQTFFFADGGVNALGANVLNMAVLGAGTGSLLHRGFFKSMPKALAIAILSFASVLTSAAVCSAEIAAAGTFSFLKTLPAMLSIHMLIGIAEGMIAASAYYLLAGNRFAGKLPAWKTAAPLFAALIIGILLSPYASPLPDGLEWVSALLSRN